MSFRLPMQFRCRLAPVAGRFVRDQRGSFMVIFALSLTVLVLGAGGALDLYGAYQNRQKLSQVAVLACQYASRPSVIQTSVASYTGTGGGAAYVSNVNAYITSALSSQGFRLTQTNGTPFSYVQNGAADVTLSASVPTVFMKMFSINSIAISTSAHCYDTPSTIAQVVANGNSTIVSSEGFENSYCSGKCGAQWLVNGGQWDWSSSIAVNNSFTNTVGYTGTSGTKWYIMGYCLEIDTVGIANATTPEGTHGAELDCDNGSGTGGNSSASTLIYLAAGTYQVQYYFVSRIPYPAYDPSVICASTAAAVSSYNNASPGSVSGLPSLAGHARTNQINVYLDLNTSGSPPTHKTIDNTQTLAGSNLIDVCVQSINWTKRTINQTITTPGYYWLTFAADGASDSYGGQIDGVKVCSGSC